MSVTSDSSYKQENVDTIVEMRILGITHRLCIKDFYELQKFVDILHVIDAEKVDTDNLLESEQSLEVLHIFIYYCVNILHGLQIPGIEAKYLSMLGKFYLANNCYIDVQKYGRLCARILGVEDYQCVHVLFYLIYGRLVTNDCLELMEKSKGCNGRKTQTEADAVSRWNIRIPKPKKTVKKLQRCFKHVCQGNQSGLNLTQQSKKSASESFNINQQCKDNDINISQQWKNRNQSILYQHSRHNGLNIIEQTQKQNKISISQKQKLQLQLHKIFRKTQYKFSSTTQSHNKHSLHQQFTYSNNLLTHAKNEYNLVPNRVKNHEKSAIMESIYPSYSKCQKPLRKLRFNNVNDINRRLKCSDFSWNKLTHRTFMVNNVESVSKIKDMSQMKTLENIDGMNQLYRNFGQQLDRDRQQLRGKQWKCSVKRSSQIAKRENSVNNSNDNIAYHDSQGTNQAQMPTSQLSKRNTIQPSLFRTQQQYEQNSFIDLVEKQQFRRTSDENQIINHKKSSQYFSLNKQPMNSSNKCYNLPKQRIKQYKNAYRNFRKNTLFINKNL